MDMLPQVGSSRPIRFDLHADAIALRRGGTRERVAAKNRRTSGGRLKTHDHVLARHRRSKRKTVGALDRERQHVCGLVVDRRHHERLKSRGSRMRSCCWRKPRVSTSRTSRLAPQQRLKRRAPSRRKRWDTQCALQPIARGAGQIEERVDLLDGHLLLRLSDFYDFVASAHLAFLEDAEVEPRPSAGGQQCCHSGLVHPNAHAITGDPRLSDLEQCAADPITVADAHCIVGQSFDREVFAELSVDEVSPLQLLLPMAIGFNLVDEDGSLLTPVSRQVALSVPI